MTLEQFYTYQEQTFDSFCKAVIRNESIDAFRELAHRREHEIEFSALPPQRIGIPADRGPLRFLQKVFPGAWVYGRGM